MTNYIKTHIVKGGRMNDPPLRPLIWVAGSWKQFSRFPVEARDEFRVQLYRVRAGKFAPDEKPLTKGPLKGLGIREIGVDFDRATYRVVYTVKLAQGVYVLHAFKKKSKSGISTPAHEMEVVRQRYAQAVRLDAEFQTPPARGHEHE
ncbi:MAG TPA: type II toxin-antitoxin system RelE/ParE family toxin [Longimicrobium sp.]|nr:type II toxin-antitoxin system RelE/ParE family toxin [Longimicrobium sp.]